MEEIIQFQGVIVKIEFIHEVLYLDGLVLLIRYVFEDIIDRLLLVIYNVRKYFLKEFNGVFNPLGHFVVLVAKLDFLKNWKWNWIYENNAPIHARSIYYKNLLIVICKA